MPVSKAQAWATEALRCSKKGKLKYDRDWSNDVIKDIVQDASNFRKCLNPACFDISAEKQNFVQNKSPLTRTRKTSPEKVPRVVVDCPIVDDQVDFGHVPSDVDSQILQRENYLRECTERSIEERRKHFASCISEIYNKAAQDERDSYIKRKLESERQMEMIRASLVAEFEEDKLRLQKFKEENELRAQLMDERIRAVEKRKLLELEAAAKKKAAEKERMDQIVNLQKHVNLLYEDIVKLTKHLNPSTVLPSEATTAMNSLTTINSGMQSIVLQCQEEGPTPVNVQKAQELLGRLRNYHSIIAKAIEKMNAETAAAAEAAKSAAAKAENANIVQKNVTNQVEIKSTRKRCTDEKAANRYRVLLEKREVVAESYRQIEQDKQLVRYKFDLMKAVCAPINAISSQSSEQLMNCLDKLTGLTNGSLVASHPAGRAFVLDQMAKKFVNQGNYVAVHRDAAFPIAAVIVGLWKTIPEFGELFMAHTYANCPYLVPFYMSDPTDTNFVLESENEIKRMSGVTRIYAAIIQSPMPKGMSQPHPHGLGNGWAWLSGILNLDPHPNITATVILTFLQVCGYALQATYKNQFQKLLLLLWEVFLPKIRAVTPTDSRVYLIRLETFLQSCIQKGRVPRPDGMLSSNFWYTR